METQGEPFTVTGVDVAALPTRDAERAVSLYVDVLGLRRSKQWGQMPAYGVETGSLTPATFADPDGNALPRHHRYAPQA